MSQETEFYKEFDKSHKQKKEKTLSAWSLTVFFIILIAIAEGIIFYLGSSLRGNIDEGLTVGKKIEDNFNLVAQPTSGEAPIYIPEGVLCAQVAKSAKEVKCSITQDFVQLSGKISGLLPQNASAFFVVNNENNKGALKLDEVKIGKISTFKFLGSPLNNVINKAVQASIGSEFRIREIDLEDSLMVLMIDK